jgi:hypothetical protein
MNLLPYPIVYVYIVHNVQRVNGVCQTPQIADRMSVHTNPCIYHLLSLVT